MITEVRRAWDRYERARGRVEGSLDVLMRLKQPALAEARAVALQHIEEAGEAFAALERAWMASEKGLPSNSKELNQSFWTWAFGVLQVVKA